MMKRSGVRLTIERDFEILRFIWRWKVVPTDIIRNRFFPGCRIRTCFNRLSLLRRENYIDSVAVRDIPQNVWTLNRRGFNAIKEFLPPDCDKGWRSESPAHDVLALKLSLGDYLADSAADDAVFSEQELRTYSANVFPPWVPTAFRRRPDGYIKSVVGDQARAMAIEIELTPKGVTDYESIGLDYAHYRGIDHVIWAVVSLKMARRLKAIFEKSPRDAQQIHSFLIAGDIHKLGWDSRIVLGGYQGHTVRQMVMAHWTKPDIDLPQYPPSSPLDKVGY
jgi:hypothetical protein